MAGKEKRMGFLERYLTVWGALCSRIGGIGGSDPPAGGFVWGGNSVK
jgi:hypothetical protein